ncbi:MAG: hypothetical protein ACE5KT_08740 [Methanosarcinales archaeon]
MDREDIIEIIRSAVAREYGEDRITRIDAFGPHEGEDLDVLIYVKGIDDREDTMDLFRKIRAKFEELDLDVPFDIIGV